MFGKIRALWRERRGQIGGVAIGLVSAAIIIGVGIYIAAEVFKAMPKLEAGSAEENAMKAAKSNIFTGLQLLAIGLIIGAAMALVALVVWRRR